LSQREKGKKNDFKNDCHSSLGIDFRGQSEVHETIGHSLHCHSRDHHVEFRNPGKDWDRHYQQQENLWHSRTADIPKEEAMVSLKVFKTFLKMDIWMFTGANQPTAEALANKME
jgi:hypothetical protein